MAILLIIFLLSAALAIIFAGVTYWCAKDRNTENVSFGVFAFVAFAIAFALTPESHRSPQEARNNANVAHKVGAFGRALEVYVKQNKGSFPSEEGWRDSLVKALEKADEEKQSNRIPYSNALMANSDIGVLKNPGRNIAYNSYLAGKNFSEVNPDGLVAFAESNVGGRDPVFRRASDLIGDRMGINAVALNAGTDQIGGTWLQGGRIDPNRYLDRSNVTLLNLPSTQHPFIVLLGKAIHYLGLIVAVVFLGLGVSGLVLGKEIAPLAGLFVAGFVLLMLITLCLPYYQGGHSALVRGYPSSLTGFP